MVLKYKDINGIELFTSLGLKTNLLQFEYFTQTLIDSVFDYVNNQSALKSAGKMKFNWKQGQAVSIEYSTFLDNYFNCINANKNCVLQKISVI